MALTPRMSDLEKRAGSQIKLEYIDVPHTTIEGRAKIVNLSQDGRPRMGIERIMTQRGEFITDEIGPNGEQVARVMGDKFDQIRIVGADNVQIANVYGPRVDIDVGGYMEITFYGTGLNVLVPLTDGVRQMTAAVDGGAEGANFLPTTSNILGARHYGPNLVVPAVSGLSEGLHTVKLKASGAIVYFAGVEIINDRSDIIVPGFTSSANKSYSSTPLSYNSGFESGTLGTKGGRVLIYGKEDGTIAHAVTPTDATQLELGAADHSNEEVSGYYNWREFGNQRGDDMSSKTNGSSDVAYVLDDGLTSMTADNASGVIAGGRTDCIAANVVGDTFVAFNFVGTGFDIIAHGDTGRDLNIIVDGVQVGSSPSYPAVPDAKRQLKGVSGLPYGTHTVVLGDAGGSSARPIALVTYQPKTPDLPEGAIPLGSYNVVADFAAASAGESLYKISTGVLRKHTAVRELLHFDGAGSWVAPSINLPAVVSGHETENTTSGAGTAVEYTFFGTGFDYRFRGVTTGANVQATIDGSDLTTANFPSLSTSSSDAEVSLNTSTGVMDTGTSVGRNGSWISVSGLPLGLHTLRLEYDSGGASMRCGALDIHAPIHSLKRNKYAINTTYRVGSDSIADERPITIDTHLDANMSQQSHLGSYGISTTMLARGMGIALKTEGRPVRLTFSGTTVAGAGACLLNHEIFIDGDRYQAQELFKHGNDGTVNNDNQVVSFSVVIPMSAGEHFFQLQSRVNVNSASYDANKTFFTVMEER